MTTIALDTTKPTSDAPPPSEGMRASVASNPWPNGWQPGDNEHTQKAVAWRAATALRRANRALYMVGKLDVSLNLLNTTMAASNAAWAKRWKTLSNLAWVVGAPVLIAAALGLARWAYSWVSTLHH